jgi:hypothetical protein
MVMEAETPVEQNISFATAQVSAKTFAARLYQRYHRTNPPAEWFTVAVPLITIAILEGRTDLVKQASQEIARLAKENEHLRRCNSRQAQQILNRSQVGSEGV